jgi:glyoxylase-like metal-dependent hydrolase (beta-lactamase superfamily II)
MTLAGTRTYVLGRRRVAVIDPGPAIGSHLDAIAAAVGEGEATILLTHEHSDHAAGADALARRIHAPVRGHARGTLRDDDVIDTEAGALRAVATPGHTPDHFAFFLESDRELFCGDLMLGGQDTAFVGAPEGDLAAYLESLERVSRLSPRRIHPAHGPAFEDPDTAIERYRRHRAERLDQVRRALGELGVEAAAGRLIDGIVRSVYGPTLEPELHDAAAAAVAVYLDYLHDVAPRRERD